MCQLKLTFWDAEQTDSSLFTNMVASKPVNLTKSTVFLMGSSGTWRIPPAYDNGLCFSPNKVHKEVVS